ncbi:MAG: hypothetical protein K2X48_11285 [Chitinophagaceae bacterium]|nr:hypothetical protein [Chitinophagaceae bacterium]
MKINQLNFEIDKLTNSIENVLTGEVFDTQIIKLSLTDIAQIKKKQWQFNWKTELKDSTKEVYKLTSVNNPLVIQGLISIEDKNDHIFMHLIESAAFNKGQAKMYYVVPGNLVAFACKISFEKGYEGFVAFDAKSILIKHYKQTLGATHLRGVRMYIETKAAVKLITKYF